MSNIASPVGETGSPVPSGRGGCHPYIGRPDPTEGAPKISFVIITARQDHPYTGRPDLYIFEPTIESLKNQTMKDFEVIIVDYEIAGQESTIDDRKRLNNREEYVGTDCAELTPLEIEPLLTKASSFDESGSRPSGGGGSHLYNERKDYFKDKSLPFKVKHVPASPNMWHSIGSPGICTQYNKGIIYSDGELLFFSGEGYIFIPEFCERLWDHYQKGYIPLAWYFFDHTFSPPDVVDATENQNAAYPAAESKLPYKISYNMSGYVGKNITMEHRPLVAFKNGASVHDATWEWWFGCSSAPREAMLEINGFDQRFDGDRSLLDCDVGSRLELAGYDKFALFKDLFIIRLPTDTRSWNTTLPKKVPIIKCNLPLIYWSRTFNHFVANDHENIDEDIKWCKEEYCAKQCVIRERCRTEYPWQYPFEHKEGYSGHNSKKELFEFWRTHQTKINLTEERQNRISGDKKYQEGTFI